MGVERHSRARGDWTQGHRERDCRHRSSRSARQAGQVFCTAGGPQAAAESLLTEIQQALYDRALLFREEHTYQASNYDELKQGVEKGFVHAYWAGTREDEDKIQDETGATIRLLPLDPG